LIRNLDWEMEYLTRVSREEVVGRIWPRIYAKKRGSEVEVQKLGEKRKLTLKSGFFQIRMIRANPRLLFFLPTVVS
jgi:hypothetical protein